MIYFNHFELNFNGIKRTRKRLEANKICVTLRVANMKFE